MSVEKEPRPRSRRHRPPVNYYQSDSNDDYDTQDDDYDPHDDDDADDDVDYEVPDLEAKQAHQLAAQARYRDRHPDRVAATQQRFLAKRSRDITKSARYRAKNPEQVAARKKLYRERNREFIAVSKQCYREKRRKQLAAARKRYKARYPERVAECDKRYRERNRDRLVEYQKRYREKNRSHLAETQKHYRENHQERILAYQQQYREAHREWLSEKEKRRYAGLGEEKRRAINERRRRLHLLKKKRMADKKRTAEKLKALGPLTVTIPLTDCLKSIPLTEYVKAFCKSLESMDTDVTPRESFLQLLEEDSHTVFDLDSGSVQVVDPPDLDDLSFLQDLWKDMSPDDWEQVMDDVEESFDVEALLPPEDLVHDMSSDEGVDLLYDFVT